MSRAATIVAFVVLVLFVLAACAYSFLFAPVTPDSGGLGYHSVEVSNSVIPSYCPNTCTSCHS